MKFHKNGRDSEKKGKREKKGNGKVKVKEKKIGRKPMNSSFKIRDEDSKQRQIYI